HCFAPRTVQDDVPLLAEAVPEDGLGNSVVLGARRFAHAELLGLVAEEHLVEEVQLLLYQVDLGDAALGLRLGLETQTLAEEDVALAPRAVQGPDLELELLLHYL